MRVWQFLCLLTAGFLAMPVQAGAPAQVKECEACHGAGGVSKEPDIPTIAGMSELYLTESFFAYRDATRPCPETQYRDGRGDSEVNDMCQVMKDLGEPELQALAAHFASLDFVPAKQPFDAAKADRGARIHDLLCEKCHADGGADPEDDAGIMAGQWAAYLEANFADYRSGARPMIDKMATKMEKLSDEDVEALIHFYASQQ